MAPHKMNYNEWLSNTKGFYKSFIAKKWAPVILIAIAIIITKSILFPADDSTQQRSEETAGNEYPKDQNGNYLFSPWDGSCIPLERFLKKNLNDADSYEHVETKAWKSLGVYIVETKFRTNNEYGSKALYELTASIDTANGNIVDIGTMRPAGQ